ncbi:MAG: hypothetical protein SFV17_16870 [Candidatus Obscuribacter sp.]|nr:hypothetical protein [Candidatus Obscuribacter sp.]
MISFLASTVSWSLLETALVVGLVALSSKKNGVVRCAVAWTVPSSLAYNFLVFYFFLPVQEGFLFGQGWTVFALTIYVGLAGFIASQLEEDSNSGFALICAALIILLAECSLWTVNTAAVTWGADKAEKFAALANIEVASPEDKLPETDTKNIVLVTPDIAQYLGQQALNSVGDNLGSLFLLRPEEWVRQSIAGHLYYAAPLEYANPLSQFGIFSKKIEASPGYVLVDAENPNADARIVSSAPLRYLPGAFFQQNLYRHVYQYGYTMLDKPTFEIDEDFHPHFTAAVLTPQFGVTGTVVKKILVVDATSGNIVEYEPGQAPAWLDRVFSSSLVTDRVFQWGLWSSADSRNQWPNFAGQYQMTPETPELVYNNSDIPVWLIPMRSHQSSNASSTGVILYDTRDNKGIFYPGLSGLGVGENVTHTFQNAASNIRSFPIDAVQLYSINSVPTWVGVYTQAQGSHGQSFAAVGLVDARHLNGANVIMAPDMNTALSRYASYLASGGGLSAAEISQLAQLQKASGQIVRLGLSVEQGESTFHVLLTGQSKPFTATLKVSRELPLMQVGDSVQIEFIGGSADLAVTSIKDLELESLTQAGS